MEGGHAEACTHQPPALARLAGRRLAWVLGLTATFTVVEVAGGWISGSLALLADAGHMFTDVAALSLAMVGSKIAQRKAAAAHHFGNLRWEVLAAMVNGLALLAIGVMITVEAFERMQAPQAIDAVLFGLVASMGLAVNLVSLKVLHGHHHHDINVRGAYLHIVGDVLGSVGAVAAALVIHFTGWLAADAIISVLISLLVFRSAWRLIYESAQILLDRVPAHVPVRGVEDLLLGSPGVTRVHDLHVWTVTSGLVAMSAHVVVPDLAQHPAVLRHLEGGLNELGINHVTIQLETGDHCGGEHCGEHDVPSSELRGEVHPHAR